MNSNQWIWRRNGRYWGLQVGEDILRIRMIDGQFILYTDTSEVVNTYPTLIEAEKAGEHYWTHGEFV